jgi:erythromycin esterase-like protein
LIEEHGFAGVAVEADWPDALRVSRYVSGTVDDADAADALAGFRRFPTWMWRNADVLDFVGWLRDFNTSRRPKRRVGFYGLDLYSLQTSIEAVVHYLERVDSAAAQRARRHYSCFDEIADPTAYGYDVELCLTKSCRDDVIQTLLELRRRSETYMHFDGVGAEDEYFYAEQNARVAKDAEETIGRWSIGVPRPGISATVTCSRRSTNLQRISRDIAMARQSSSGPTTHRSAMPPQRQCRTAVSLTSANSRVAPSARKLRSSASRRMRGR